MHELFLPKEIEVTLYPDVHDSNKLICNYKVSGPVTSWIIKLLIGFFGDISFGRVKATKEKIVVRLPQTSVPYRIEEISNITIKLKKE